jgi:hypothetical protein
MNFLSWSPYFIDSIPELVSNVERTGVKIIQGCLATDHNGTTVDAACNLADSVIKMRPILLDSNILQDSEAERYLSLIEEFVV